MDTPDEPKNPNVPGRQLPHCVEDFGPRSTLSDAEKEFVVDVVKILCSHSERGTMRKFILWAEKHPDRPDWVRNSPTSLKNTLYSALGCSSKKLLPWPAFEWILASSLEGSDDREEVEFSLAHRYLKLTGRYPEGYVNPDRPLPGYESMTVDDAPDIRTKARLLALELERKNQFIDETTELVRSLRGQVDSLSAGRERQALQHKTAEIETAVSTLQLAMHELRARSSRRIFDLERAGTRSANYVAVLSAWMDTYNLTHDEFTTDVRKLNVHRYPDAQVPRILTAPPQPKYRAVTRWVSVYLRAFLLARYGPDLEAAHIDDSTGQLSALIEHGLLPSQAAVQPLLDAHGFLNRFVPRMLSEALAECSGRAAERASMAETAVMDALPATDTGGRRAPVVLGRGSPTTALARIHDFAEAQVRRNANAQTVVLRLSDLTHEGITSTDDPADDVIARLRDLEARSA
ncbi:hypothetical protein AB0E59_06185 [Lentzea sp. NPDC034063]|uniref:hypothetical protein n=1 Tax=unclassified Lentzea TaxID=2643253 RepID=UPI0033F6A555